VEDGTRVPFGRCTVEVVHIGGHTPGSIVLAAGGSLLTGDCLFPGGVGGTFGNQGDFATLLGQVERRLFDRYYDDVVVLPGHGEATTIGAERPFLDEWRARGW
jgi:glyoxylase-like metal-dependent hydrolase (beta-lactamase superfamily II)